MEVGQYKHGFHRQVTSHTQKHDSIWVIVDRLTKTAHFIPVHTTYLAERYAEIYVALIVRLHRIPKTILSDRGTQFFPHLWAQVHESLVTKLIHSSAITHRLMVRRKE
jgi:hypothetical protein